MTFVFLAAHPWDAHADLIRHQSDGDEAAGEVLLLFLQQVFSLVQGDVQQRGPCIQLQRNLQLANCELMAEGMGDWGDGAEWIRGDGAVQATSTRVQLSAHQFQCAQLPEPIRSVCQLQAGLTAGWWCPPVIRGCDAL